MLPIQKGYIPDENVTEHICKKKFAMPPCSQQINGETIEPTMHKRRFPRADLLLRILSFFWTLQKCVHKKNLGKLRQLAAENDH